MDKIILAGCAIVKENKILLIHRISKSWWELPGGKVDEGESLEQTAVREIKEELGCDVQIIKKLGTDSFKQEDRFFEYHWFLAQTRPGSIPTIKEPDSYDDMRYFLIEELEEIKLSLNMEKFLEHLTTGKFTL
jgi:8-oxo-dGTP diphosphatase